MTDITKYKSLAADLEDYAIVAEIRKTTGLPVKAFLRSALKN